MNMIAPGSHRMAAVALGLSALSKTYGAAAVVDGVDLNVEPGQLISLLGPSGCGKTTTLRMIAGLITPTAGAIHFGDRNVTGIPVHHRNVGVLFQNYALFPHMTVAGNVAFGLEMRSRDRRRNRALVDDALAMVQLTRFADRYPHELSGGQQQRVALARALAIEPQILLLDEPFAALDRKLREEMQIQIKDLQRRIGITTVMVTHDQEEALTMSDQIAVMNNGRIEQYAAPGEVYDRPATRFVAQFIGVSNLFEGEVAERRQHDSVVRTASGVLMTARETGNRARVTLCLRPEAIRIAPAAVGAEPGVDSALGTVSRIVQRGSITEYHLRLACGDTLIACRPSGESDGLTVGLRVIASWASERIHLLV
ncbi:ABC transporter ATP-binding protein [Bosea sp. BK604]|uniref:ABC transporter ATP-binding protein n=1 Tax=Bosea sp. BK604 TaxID=2512180 RepID=UPI0010E8A71D|nr:ABC transporter ATP-binding protein [Bosea sp. BK604]TCR70426.1 putative spermidine/putrescine transport system ATP-binding protein [Bosea sp. BK604]